MRPIHSVSVAGAMLVLMANAAAADPIEDFYKGKQVNWILSAGAGGGYSSYAHVFAPYFSAHIPGKPNIIVQNMPGAGGIRAMQYLSTVAPKEAPRSASCIRACLTRRSTASRAPI